jgi:hypothetical protein
MSVNVGFLFFVKFNLLCSRCMVRPRKFSFLSASFSIVIFFRVYCVELLSSLC